MSEHDPPEYVVQHVRDALATDGRSTELGVHVSVRGNVVILDGAVATDELRRAVAEVAADAAPDFDVRNDVHVVELAGHAAVEELD